MMHELGAWNGWGFLRDSGSSFVADATSLTTLRSADYAKRYAATTRNPLAASGP